MHYLVVRDGEGERVVFKGTRQTLEGIACKLRQDLPTLRIRVTRHPHRAALGIHRDVRAEGWAVLPTG